VIHNRRCGPADFDARLSRCDELLASTPSASEPLTVLAHVLEHQRRRVATPQVSTAVERMVADEPTQRWRHEYPLLDPFRSVDLLAAELELATADLDGESLPVALRTSGDEVHQQSARDRAEIVEAWLDMTDELAAPIGFWCRVSFGPVFELAAAAVLPVPAEWFGRHCPVCGGPPQVSVITGEPGEFLGRSPRHLVCARCAAWWSFPRATCPVCGEPDPHRVNGFTTRDSRAVRIEGCAACHTYVKSFDLREPGALNVVPLVDDMATLSLDLWAQAQGFHPASPSLAGM
jgi:Protein involved in formate dehydrogenase formation